MVIRGIRALLQFRLPGLRLKRIAPETWGYVGDVPPDLGPSEVRLGAEDLERDGAYLNADGHPVIRYAPLFSSWRDAQKYAQDHGHTVRGWPQLVNWRQWKWLKPYLPSLRITRVHEDGPWVFCGDVPARLGPWEAQPTAEEIAAGVSYLNRDGVLVVQRIHVFRSAQCAREYARDYGYIVEDCPSNYWDEFDDVCKAAP